MLEAEQLHRHARSLGKLDGVVAEREQVEVAAEDGVERVAAFVEQRLHVAVQADAVDEQERQSDVFELVLVAARRLALAVHQVEQLVVDERLELSGKARIDLREQLAAEVDQLLLGLEGPQRRLAVEIDFEIPRTKRRNGQLLRAGAIELYNGGHDALRNRVLKAFARSGVVVVAAEFQEAERRVRRVARVLRHALSQADQRVVDLLEFLPLLLSRGERCAPCAFAQIAILALVVGRHLLQRVGLALKLDGDAAEDRLLARLQLGLFLLQRGVLLAEQLALRLALAQQHGEALRIELRAALGREESLVELVRERLHARHDLLLQVEVALLLGRVLGVARHRDVAARLLGADAREQLALVAEPRLGGRRVGQVALL